MCFYTAGCWLARGGWTLQIAGPKVILAGVKKYHLPVGLFPGIWKPRHTPKSTRTSRWAGERRYLWIPASTPPEVCSPSQAARSLQSASCCRLSFIEWSEHSHSRITPTVTDRFGSRLQIKYTGLFAIDQNKFLKHIHRS